MEEAVEQAEWQDRAAVQAEEQHEDPDMQAASMVEMPHAADMMAGHTARPVGESCSEMRFAAGLFLAADTASSPAPGGWS